MISAFLDLASMELMLLIFKNAASLNLSPGMVRLAGTWDPLLHCCNACTWTNLSSSNKIQRNYMGLKITACMRSWGKFWTKDTKRPKKSHCHFWRAGSKNRGSGAKAGYCTCPLHTTPPKEWANHLSYPPALTPGHTPTLTQYKEPAHGPPSAPPAGVSKQGKLFLVLAPPLLQQGPQ